MCVKIYWNANHQSNIFNDKRDNTWNEYNLFRLPQYKKYVI